MFIIEWLLDRLFPKPEAPQFPAVAVNVNQRQTVKKTVKKATTRKPIAKKPAVKKPAIKKPAAKKAKK
jgi:DnaK suppressor protein